MEQTIGDINEAVGDVLKDVGSVASETVNDAVGLVKEAVLEANQEVVKYNKRRTTGNLIAMGLGTGLAVMAEKTGWRMLGAAWAGLGLGSYLGRTMAVDYLTKSSKEWAEQ